ncbi:MAG: HAD family phosphatase [Sediminibacterium sp.]|jgi:glucose-1-phosphatase
MQGVKNIIFDLGGVLFNIDFKKTEAAFVAIGVENFSEMFGQHHSNDLFIQLETGAISPNEFYDAFRTNTQLALTNDQIKTAWNALLIDFRLPSLEWLKSIKNKYRIFLFSNTNQIHYESFLETYFNQTGKTDFNDFFEKAYYSQEMGLRKPSLEPFIQILENHGLVAAETVFIDDTLKNIEAAQQVGIQTIHLQWPQTLPELDL